MDTVYNNTHWAALTEFGVINKVQQVISKFVAAVSTPELYVVNFGVAPLPIEARLTLSGALILMICLQNTMDAAIEGNNLGEFLEQPEIFHRRCTPQQPLVYLQQLEAKVR